MMDFVIGVLTACAGALGFAFLFRVDLKYIPWATIGGGVSWAVYLLVFEFLPNVFVSALACAAAATVYSEILAYICRTPATVFLMPSLIPMVPGGSLYYTMSNLIMKDYSAAAVKGVETAEVMLGASGGVVAASLVIYAIRHIGKKSIR
ncbi:MAG: threonine/serine exporter family protein [Clostridia bacterium]|nr:threonine/serine exporter family protein [Clostridia bacterium]